MERDPLTGVVIGAAIEVHRELGPGLLEAVYELCLCRELSLRGISYERQRMVPIIYKGHRLESELRLDIVVEERLVIELKVVERLLGIHDAQVLTYMRLSKIPLGLLLNFNVPVLKDGIKRFVL